MTLITTARLIVRVAGYHREVMENGDVAQANLDVALDQEFDFGSDNDETNSIWKSARELAANTLEDLDLSALGNLFFNNDTHMSKLKVLFVKAADDNRDRIIVGGAASNPFTGPFITSTTTISIPSGGVLVLADKSEGAWDITGSSFRLRVANPSTLYVARYQIAIVGRI